MRTMVLWFDPKMIVSFHALNGAQGRVGEIDHERVESLGGTLGLHSAPPRELGCSPDGEGKNQGKNQC